MTETLDIQEETITGKYQPDAAGFYGDFGGAFIPEMLYHNVETLRKNYLKIINSKDFQQTSMGEQRLILLLKALVQNPELLILDEPFQGMDIAMIEKSKQLINDFCKDRTLILVTHYIEEIPTCVEHFFNLNNGVSY